jgi:transposase
LKVIGQRYGAGMLVRYRYRIYPSPGHQKALARVFGCTRVVYNDCLRLREACHAAGEKISDNQAIYAEDIAVSGLARTRLARSVHDAGWSQFLRLIEEKAAHYGREFRRIGRFEPTSQVCSACGVKDGPKPLHVRQWSCLACETVHDRDVNAAKNILAAGRADKSNACGTGVRPPLTVAAGAEAGTHRSAA